jgi:hypothetical protein
LSGFCDHAFVLVLGVDKKLNCFHEGEALSEDAARILGKFLPGVWYPRFCRI